jgi:tetratricopeptide (TPR) repeat protein/predicted transcriptional regulator with HTH domain
MRTIREGNQSKITQAWQDLLSELYSWLRWFYVYLLPSWLSFPFQFSAVRILYALALLALVLVYIPIGPFRFFIQESMVDLWKKLVGENSANALSTLLQSFPVGWVLLSLVILVLWGLIVTFWGWKQYRFFKLVQETGIKIVRGPGRRSSFFDRLQKAGISALGLGPTARLLPIYVTRKEDAVLKERISAYKKERLNFGILITGIATSGKTRTAMELIADVTPALVFVWPRALSISTGLNVPAWNGSAILFTDNITLSVGGGDVPLSAPMLQLLQDCSRLVLVGTIRRTLLSEDLRGLESIELSEIQPSEPALHELAQFVESAESSVQGARTGAEKVMQRYNGHPAGLVAGVDAMRGIYKQLEADQRSFLRAAKLLRTLGIQDLSVVRIRETAELINEKQFPEAGFHDQLEELKETGLINWVGEKSRKHSIDVYEGYLDGVIDLPNEYIGLEEKILSCWREREDAEAFVNRGDWCSEQYTSSYQDNPQSALLSAISFYTEALRSYTEERAPLDYAMTQNNLGTAYGDLAGYQEPVENLQRAIQAYTEALRSYTEERAPLQYAMTQNNLGTAYGNLAGYQEPVENLQRAIQAYTQALHFRTEERAPLQYAMTQNNLGNAYGQLATLLRAEYRFDEAIFFFEKSHEISPRVTTALNLAGIHKQLGKDDLFRKYIDEARRLVKEDDWYNLTCLESLAGNTDAAFEYLKRAVENIEFDRAWAWKDSDLEILRRDRRFEQIVGAKP